MCLSTAFCAMLKRNGFIVVAPSVKERPWSEDPCPLSHLLVQVMPAHGCVLTPESLNELTGHLSGVENSRAAWQQPPSWGMRCKFELVDAGRIYASR